MHQMPLDYSPAEGGVDLINRYETMHLVELRDHDETVRMIEEKLQGV
jgi:hypothetical protein